ncbi:MAG: ABC transporter permease subunit [Solobacterium sp.]|jgi:NitT/TauT family transport system permease protein|nr:ABC transporter permease subunit [Solobacterium sp.]MCH4222186.1 ABC transporter permease subunit [Solobacterium sp.]
MKKEHVITISALLICWQIAASAVHNDILIPYPATVLMTFVSILTTASSYLYIFRTVTLVLEGFLLSLICALICSILSDSFPVFRRLFEPIQVILKTIPNVSYIIMALIWLGAEGAVSAVSFMILFPVFFANFQTAMDQEGAHQKDAACLYEETFWMKLRYKTLPQLYPSILQTGRTAASLGLKVGVMAEILGQVKQGIGKQLYLAKIFLDTSSLLAWTLVLILLSVLFDQLFKLLINYQKKEEFQA